MHLAAGGAWVAVAVAAGAGLAAETEGVQGRPTELPSAEDNRRLRKEARGPYRASVRRTAAQFSGRRRSRSPPVQAQSEMISASRQTQPREPAGLADVLRRWTRRGTGRSESPQEDKHIVVLNVLTLTTTVSSMLYAILFAALGSPTAGVASLLGALLTLLTYFLSSGGAFWFARLFFFSGATALVVYFCTFLGRDPGVHLFFLLLSTMPLALTSTRDRGSLAYGIVVPLLGYAGLEATDFGGNAPVLSAEANHLFYVSVIFTMAGLLILLVGTATRAGERLFLESEDARRLNSTVLDNVHNAVVVTDASGRILRANPAANDLCAAGALEGMEIASLMGLSPAQRARGVCAGGGGVSRETLLYSLDHEEIPIEMRSSTTSANGAKICTVVIRDLRAEKSAALRQEQLNEELMASSRRLSNIASGLLHNVGNALTSVNISAQQARRSLSKSKLPMLRRTTDLLASHSDDLLGFLTDDPRGQKVVPALDLLTRHLELEKEALADELMRVTEGVEEIHHVVRHQRENTTIARKVVRARLEEPIEAAIRLTRSCYDCQRVTLVRVPLPQELPDQVQMDLLGVTEILVDLLENAFEAVRDTDGRERRVAIEVRPAGKSLRISIADNGAGIDPVDAEQIFQSRFTTKAEHNGFGLHRSANLARAMGGYLSFESRGRGAGATFTLQFPLSPAPVPPSPA